MRTTTSSTRTVRYDLLFLLEAARLPSRLPTGTRTLRRADRNAAKRTGGRADRQRRLPAVRTAPNDPAQGRGGGRGGSRHGEVARVGRCRTLDRCRRPLPPEGKARVLDLASDFTNYLYSKGYPEGCLPRALPADPLGPEHGGGSAARIRPLSVPLPESGHSCQGPPSRRSPRRPPVSRDRLPPAVSFLEDPAEGFNDGSQIIFAEAAVRWYPGRKGPPAATGLTTSCPSPHGTSFSSRLMEGADGVRDPGLPRRRRVARVRAEPGGGFAWKVHPSGSLPPRETDLAISGRYDRSFALGMGAPRVLPVRCPTGGGLLAQARYIYGVFGDREEGRRFTASLKVPVRLSRNRSVILMGTRGGPSVHAGTIRLTWNAHF